MKNIFELYDKIDEKIMVGVNAGVKGYNWTTGGTKTDLANKMLNIAPVMESIGFINSNYIAASILVPLYLFLSHKRKKNNEIMEKKEIKALEDHALNFEVEEYKNKSRTIGNLMFLNVPVWTFMHSDKGLFLKDTVKTDYIASLGFIVRSASYYVSRADLLPPRKNCLSRGIDKFSEWYEQQSEPAGVPVAAFARYYNLEEIV